MALCHECGWTSDVVHSDYGEDLIVQSCLDGKFDPFRTLIQVKATTRIPKGKRGKITIQVSRSHALRWIQSREPVIVVLWDTNSKRGWFSLPMEQFNLWELLRSKRSRLTMSFNPNQYLNRKAFEGLIWRLRFDYFQERILAEMHTDQMYLLSKKTFSKAYRSGVPIVVFEMFRTLGIANSERLSPTVRVYFTMLFKIFADDTKSAA